MTHIDTPAATIYIDGIPALDDNYIWIITQGNNRLVIDPGEADPVISWFDAQQLVPSGILITHNHHDHIGGITGLIARYGQIPIYAHQGMRLPMPYRMLATDVEANILGIAIEIIDLSGHTPDQIGFYLPQAQALFCGDALFAGGCGRLFNGGTPAQMTASLARIAALPIDTRIYCAHEYTVVNLRFAQIVEPNNMNTRQRLIKTIALRREGAATVPSLLADELATNPFLRTEAADVHTAIDQIAGYQTLDAVDRFTQLRQWKDQLDQTGQLELAP